MSLKSSIIILSSLIVPLSFANSSSETTKLFLVGGGLKTCSTMSKSNCIAKDFGSEHNKTSALYQLNKNNISKIFEYWPVDHLPKQRQPLKKLLFSMAKKNNKVINKASLRSLWRRLDNNNVIDKLADNEFNLMLDNLEVLVANKSNQRLKEQVNLEESKNLFSVEIFKQFVSLSKEKALIKGEKRKPKILVVTASARDTFEAVDFYIQAFSQAGADVEWLPVDATVNFAWQQSGQLSKHCKNLSIYRQTINKSFNRENVFPEHTKLQESACLVPDELIKKIQLADGLFINGGDQSLTRQAFKNADHSDNALLNMIKIQMSNNLLLVGGTSAGTAVMSGGSYQRIHTPMITNGRSEVAINRGAKADQLPNAGCHKLNTCNEALLNGDLTFNSNGGLGLFPWGIMDTHFSERGRQGRLAQLIYDTNTPFAFGVDEATALEVSWSAPSKVSMRVAGQGGIFIVEPETAKTQSDNKTFTTHYITRDDEVELSGKNLSFKFADWKINHKAVANHDLKLVDIFEGENYRNLAQLLCLSENNLTLGSSNWNKLNTNITLEKSSTFEQVTGGLLVGGTKINYCSYINLNLSF